jgi:hypothetical protein
MISLTFASLVEFRENLSSLKVQVEQKLKQMNSSNRFLQLLEHIRSFFEQYQNASTRVYRMVQQKLDLGSLHAEDKNLFFMQSRLSFFMKELRMGMDRSLIMSVFEYQAAIQALLSSFSDRSTAGCSSLEDCLSGLSETLPALGPFLSDFRRAFNQPDLKCSPLEFLQPRVKGYIRKKLEITNSVSLAETDLADFFQFAEIKHPTLSAYVVLAQQLCKRADERCKKSFLLLVDVGAVDRRC